MRKSAYKPGLLLLCAALLSGLSTAGAQQEVTKEFHKEYKVTEGTALSISNKYGDVVVETDESDQVTIDVKVTVRYPNREKAEELLGYIDVKFTEGTDLIEAETVIDDKFRFTGWGSESRKFSINYNVKMPEKMALTLSNRYGDTDLDDLKGLVNLDIKYGNLTASKLLRGDEKPFNTLVLAYGKGTIEEAGWLDATIRYSGNFTIEKSQALLLDSKYSKLNLGPASSIVGESKYDNLKIESINNLVLDAGYADINVGTLAKKLVFDGGYGSFNVESIPSGFESLEVNSRYMGVGLGIEEGASFNLDGKIRYGNLKYNEDNFQNKKRIIENNSTEIAGIVGKNESTEATVKVTASYGTVRLY